ncbi:MAG: tetratricopeptide repeat protein, partial [Opitutaceae bacterium]
DLSLVKLAAQQPPEEEAFPTKREMPGRGIKGAGFAGLKPEEAQEAAELLAKGQRLEEEGELRAAAGMYKRVYKRFPRSASAPEAYYRTAQIELKRNRPLQAFEAIDAIVRAYPSYGKFNELIAEEYRIAYELINGRRLRMMWGLLPGFANEDRGIYFMERLIFNAPYSDYAPLALMNIAEAHARGQRTEAALDALDRLITNYPNSILAPDGYLRMAEVHEQTVDGPLYDQSATKESINYYEDFLILFPRHSEVAQAENGLARMKEMLASSRFKIADFYYHKRANYDAARVFYNEAITIAPNSESARLARERIAQVDVDEAQYEALLAARAEEEPGKFLGIFGGARRTGRVSTEASQPEPVPEEPADQQTGSTVTTRP